jgi:ribosomal protein S18 acetylase RimI-like enzyme
MTADDIDQATAVLREHDPDQDSGEWVARLGRDVAAAVKHPVVAVVRGEVVGYARTMPFHPEGDSPADAAPGGHYLLGLVVAPAHRRRGLGRLLTDERLRWLTERHPGTVYYYTHRNNAASRLLHEQLGFRRLTDTFWFPALPRDHSEVLYALRWEDPPHGPRER